MPWQLKQAFAENARSSWMSTCTLSEASGETLRGARFLTSLWSMPQ
jgi:hypothetical protein